jgi:hypothetical protein
MANTVEDERTNCLPQTDVNRVAINYISRRRFSIRKEIVKMNERETILEFLSRASDYDLSVLFEVLDVAHQNLIYETTDELLVMDQFMTSLWIATRSNSI